MEQHLWKILVADDEKRIRSGIHNLVERMGIPVTVCGEAEDGEIALEMTESLRPDIMLADINMPFLNGLDLIEALRRTRADMKIIVITGYEKFDYALRALDLGVSAYLLKPIDEKELKKAILAAVDELADERAHKRSFEWAIDQIGRRREPLMETILRDAAAGRLEPSEIEEYRTYLDFPAFVGARLMLVATRGGAAGEKSWEKLIERYVLQEILEDEPVAGVANCHIFLDDIGQIALLFEANETAAEAVRAQVTRVMREQLSLDAQVEMARVQGLAQLSDAYDEALERLRERVGLSPVVDAAKAYIQAHYQQSDLDLGKVAGALNVHPVHLSRLMKAELGESFARYLTHVRISRAVKLMRDPDVRIRQAAEMVGYSNPNYFSAAFKKVLGVPPAEYRAPLK